MRQIFRWFLFIAVLATTACTAPSSATPPASPTPAVVSTRLTALLVGELAVVDGCVRMKAADGHASYLLVWPPDFDFSVEGASVRVSDRLKGQEVTWRTGDIVRVGGGETSSVDAGLRQRLPANCAGPYWMFGGWLEPTLSPR